MLSNIIEKVKQCFAPASRQETLDAFIEAQHPTSVCDVEYWINVYDRRQYAERSSNFSYHYR
jgi:hypothetical protein